MSTLFRRLDANVEPTFAKRRQNNVAITLTTLSTYFQPNFDVVTTSYARWVMFPNTAESNVIVQWRKSVAVDSNDNIYALTRLRTRNKNGSAKSNLVLYVFDDMRATTLSLCPF